MKSTIHYGKTVIDYELLLMNRKSLEIAVHPDKSVVVKAPRSSSVEEIEERLHRRTRWIKRQITYFSQFDPRTLPRRYVGGESHRYLGRQYRLKIEKAKNDNVLLKNGYFYIECRSKEPSHIKALLDTWYRQKADRYIPKVFDDCWARFNKGKNEKPTLKLRKMKTRWGSLSSKGRLTVNLILIQSPKECIEYVVMHELCHLMHHNHGPAFYKQLETIMPDWKKIKHKLELSMA